MGKVFKGRVIQFKEHTWGKLQDQEMVLGEQVIYQILKDGEVRM